MPPPAQLDDALLVGRVAERDPEAFAELYDRHSAPVFGLLLRMAGDRGEAEELLQELFLQAWREAGRYRSEGAAPRSWLLMMARSRAIDRIRSRSSRTRREEAVMRDDLAAAGAVAPAGPERLEARERRRRVAEALALLPDEQRRAIEHAFFGGLTHREIAARLGEPLGTIKSRILLGMRRLRQALEP